MRQQYGGENNQLPTLVALSHELKAPLALMRHIALASKHYDDQEKAIAFDRIRLTAERSLRLTEALTRSYRTSDLDSEPVNVGRLCDEIAHELLPLCKELGQNIELHIPKQSLLAVGNRDLMSSVVFGLCDNALNYGQTDAPIRLEARRVGEYVRLAVRDYGPSIFKSELRKLKSRLGSAPQPINRRPNSSGLGLYIAGQFAEAMGGELGITRHQKGGHTFYIDVPTSSQLSLI